MRRTSVAKAVDRKERDSVLEIVETVGRADLAIVHVARTPSGKWLEFVEALVPPHPREEKWVLIVSTLFGCPVGCLMCDSGHAYHGVVSEGVLWAQIDDLVYRCYPSGVVPTRKLKLHFARMGEPAFNPHVNRVLAGLRGRYDAPGLLPSLSTVAPEGTDAFFEDLLDVRRRHYPEGNFQLQFSIHTTDPAARDELIPVRKWDFSRIARYGEEFHRPGGGRRVTLNFAASTRYPVEPSAIRGLFDPRVFMIKITPLNPSLSAARHGLRSLVSVDPSDPIGWRLEEGFRALGYEAILSIGEPEENRIGSNCGLRVMRAQLISDY